MKEKNRKAVIGRDGRSLEFIHRGKWVRLALGFSIWDRLDEVVPAFKIELDGRLNAERRVR